MERYNNVLRMLTKLARGDDYYAAIASALVEVLAGARLYYQDKALEAALDAACTVVQVLAYKLAPHCKALSQGFEFVAKEIEKTLEQEGGEP